MNITICEKCGAELRHGDYPFCDAPGGHGSIFRQNSLHFSPVLVYQMADGSHYYPGNNTDKPPVPDAKPILLDTLRKADAFVRETNLREQYEMDRRTEDKRNHFDRAQRESRSRLLAQLDRAGISKANAQAIIADRDGIGPSKEVVMKQFEDVARASGQPFNRDRAEQIFEQTQKSRVNPNYRGRPQSQFMIEPFAMDSSNRTGWRDERTGWREKRS